MAIFRQQSLAGQITLVTFTGHFFSARQDQRTLLTKTKVFHQEQISVYSPFRKASTKMEYIFNHPWELGLLLAIVLAVALDLGRRVAVRYQIEVAPQRKEQMGTIRDGLFILVSLLLDPDLRLRFMERRSLLVEEAISTGTTYLRAGTLPQP